MFKPKDVEKTTVTKITSCSYNTYQPYRKGPLEAIT